MARDCNYCSRGRVSEHFSGSGSCQVIYSQFGLAIHQNVHQARRRFVEWAQNEIAVVPNFHKRILFSDEPHFWLNGYVNKQNCRIWSEANPQVYVETPLHPEKLTESLVYADKPQTLDHLEDNIRRVIADIQPQMLEKVIKNWTTRLDYIRASRGSHTPEIIFKMEDIENYVEFLSEEMPDVKINDNCLLEVEVERRLNVYLNSNKIEQLENQHAAKLVKDG
ncbi:uncharacterized protein TNCV_2857381 [Trichonephila clavipes]|nr:uncharacterized protein TNCV_2857381 [Trichonephila clavipes]